MTNNTALDNQSPDQYQARLRRPFVERLGLEDLKTLAFDIGLDLNDIPEQGRPAKAAGLIAVMVRQDRLDELLEAARQARPNQPWPDPPVTIEAGQPLLPACRNPEPGLVNPSSHLPRRNHRFVGRENTLRKIAGAFNASSGQTLGQVVILSGIAGIGKTQLANEFAHRYGRFFLGGVYWLTFGEEGNPEADVLESGHKMQLPDFAHLEVQDRLLAVRRAWQDAIPRLLIFDDCRTEVLLRYWLPDFGGSYVLVTSWQSDHSLLTASLPVCELRSSHSIALLQHFRSDLSEKDAASIAEELGQFPLALWMAGCYLLETQSYQSPGDYLQELRQIGPIKHVSLRDGIDDESPTRHLQDVGRTFALSYRRLRYDERDRLARDLLHRAAFFAPGEVIPWRLLAEVWNRTYSVRIGEPSSVELGRSLNRLRDLGLITLTAGNPTLHILVAEFVQAAAEEEGTSVLAQKDVEAALISEASRINEAGLTGPLLIWQGHLRYVAEAAYADGRPDAGILFYLLGFHLRLTGDFDQARKAHKRALSIAEAIYGPDDPNVAVAADGLGLVLHELGDLDAANKEHERAISIGEAVYGADSRYVANYLSNLGGVLYDLQNYAAARAAFSKALHIDEATFGPDDPRVAVRINNLGLVLQSQGDSVAAKQAYVRALAIDENAHGPDHPSVARDLNNLVQMSGNP